MSTIKTQIDNKKVEGFLISKYGPVVSKPQLLKGGEMAQALSFTADGKEYVIRLYKKDYSFEKDNYAYKNFYNSKILIPRILEIGKFDQELFYAISELAKGQTIDTFPQLVKKELLPQILQIHDEIRNTKIVGNGYGHWEADGNAPFSSWKDFLLTAKDDVFNNWDTLYSKTFLEQDVIETLSLKITQLAEFAPEERHLIHGDFGGNNMTAESGKITGVLDWGESKYGDFLYDVAWISFWEDEIDYESHFKKHYDEIGLEVKNFNERLTCHKLHLGLGGIGFFALSNQKESYDWTKEKLLKLAA